jgi:rhomboid protease GluP
MVKSGASCWKRARVTWVLIVVNVLWYVVVETRTGRSDQGLVHAGAVYSVDVFHGQWYRLLSAMFVHMSVVHITLNMVSLANLYVVEIILGAWPFAFLYVVSGFVGNLLGLWLLPGYAVAAGASGAIFGVFAAALVLSFKGFLNKAARNQLLILLVINFVYDLSNAHIDSSAHFGGLVAGIVVTLGLIRWRKFHRRFQVLGGVSVAVTGVALVIALINMG